MTLATEIKITPIAIGAAGDLSAGVSEEQTLDTVTEEDSEGVSEGASELSSSGWLVSPPSASPP